MTRPHHRQHTHTPCNAPPTTQRAEVPAGTIYTCPMHPEIRQIGPGHCPKCGMALEPLVPTEVENDGEIRSVRRRFWRMARASRARAHERCDSAAPGTDSQDR